MHFEEPVIVASGRIAHEAVNVIEADDDGEACPCVSQSGRLACRMDLDRPVIIESLALRARRLRPQTQRLPLGLPEHLTVHSVEIIWPIPARQSREYLVGKIGCGCLNLMKLRSD
jgi:hypothetical protein